MLKTARLFKYGDSQAVKLPQEFQFDGRSVYIKRMGNVVVLIPKNNPWQSLFDSLDQFTDDYLEQRQQPPQQERDVIYRTANLPNIESNDDSPAVPD